MQADFALTIGLVPLRTFLNRSESLTLDQLERVLGGTPYAVSPKTRVKDVVDPGEHATLPERRIVWGHFDFLVFNRVSGQPEFAVEFDGPTHCDPDQAERDRAKDELCLREGLPILRIGTDDIAPREQCSLLEWLLERFVGHRQAQQHRSGSWVPNPGEAEHTMPAISAVLNRLHRDFGIVAGGWDSWGRAASHSSRAEAHFVVVPERTYIESLGLSAPGGRYESSVQPFHTTGEARVELVRRDDRPIFTGQGRVLIADRTIDHGGMLDDLFGIRYEQAQACLAEFLALREVERYACRHLLERAA